MVATRQQTASQDSPQLSTSSLGYCWEKINACMLKEILVEFSCYFQPDGELTCYNIALWAFLSLSVTPRNQELPSDQSWPSSHSIVLWKLQRWDKWQLSCLWDTWLGRHHLGRVSCEWAFRPWAYRLKMVLKTGEGPRCSVFLCVRWLPTHLSSHPWPSCMCPMWMRRQKKLCPQVAAGPPKELKMLYL